MLVVYYDCLKSKDLGSYEKLNDQLQIKNEVLEKENQKLLQRLKANILQQESPTKKRKCELEPNRLVISPSDSHCDVDGLSG